jgi:hypothetical protein
MPFRQSSRATCLLTSFAALVIGDRSLGAITDLDDHAHVLAVFVIVSEHVALDTYPATVTEPAISERY